MGGLENYTVRLSDALIGLGHEVHVFANTWDYPSMTTLHRISMIKYSSPLKNLSFAYFASKLVDINRFHVVHSMERIFRQDIFRASDGINPIQLLVKYRNPLIRRLKAIGPRRLALMYLEKQIFLGGACRYVITNSHLVKKQIVTYYGLDPEKIFVIYNPVDLVRFNPANRNYHNARLRAELGIELNDTILLFVANDFRLKRLDMVIDALNQSQDTSLKLLVVGAGKKGPYLKRAYQHGLGRQVYFLGRRADIERFYGAADIFILPTLYDPFANVCLEAMASGVPVITSNNNGASELIKDGVNGYILNQLAASELTKKISLLKDKTLRSKMALEARKAAESLTFNAHMTQLLDLYERVKREKIQDGAFVSAH